jgi:hypothetical protein
MYGQPFFQFSDSLGAGERYLLPGLHKLRTNGLVVVSGVFHRLFGDVVAAFERLFD